MDNTALSQFTTVQWFSLSFVVVMDTQARPHCGLWTTRDCLRVLHYYSIVMNILFNTHALLTIHLVRLQ